MKGMRENCDEDRRLGRQLNMLIRTVAKCCCCYCCCSHTDCVCEVFSFLMKKFARGTESASERERLRLWAYIEKDSFKLLTINEALHVAHFHVTLNFRTVAVFFFSVFFFFLSTGTHTHIVCKAKYVRLWERGKTTCENSIHTRYALNVRFVSYLFIISKWTIFHYLPAPRPLALDSSYWYVLFSL